MLALPAVDGHAAEEAADHKSMAAAVDEEHRVGGNESRGQAETTGSGTMPRG